MQKIAFFLILPFVLLLSSYSLSSYSNSYFQYENLQRQWQTQKVLNENRKLAFQRTKAMCLQNKRLSEGLRLVPYHCTAGQNTIGYGHCNREKLQQITVLQADSILFSDFEFALNYAQKRTGLVCECSLVLASFIFAHGIGTFDKSKIVTQKLFLNSRALLQELQTYQRTKSARKARKFDKTIIEHCKH